MNCVLQAFKLCLKSSSLLNNDDVSLDGVIGPNPDFDAEDYAKILYDGLHGK